MHLATLRESKTHFGLPWVRPGTIAVNVTWIEREFNAGQMPCSMYPSIFNSFSVIQAGSLKVPHFSTFFAHFGLPCICPWDYRSKSHVEREFNACQTPHSMYPSIFNHFWDMAIYRWRVTGFQQFLWANERFLPHFAFPGYASGTIAVNVIRLERGFNACKMPPIYGLYTHLSSTVSEIGL